MNSETKNYNKSNFLVHDKQADSLQRKDGRKSLTKFVFVVAVHK